MKKPKLQLCADCKKPIPTNPARLRCRECARRHNYSLDVLPPVWVLPGPVNTMEKDPDSSTG